MQNFNKVTSKHLRITEEYEFFNYGSFVGRVRYTWKAKCYLVGVKVDGVWIDKATSNFSKIAPYLKAVNARITKK